MMTREETMEVSRQVVVEPMPAGLDKAAACQAIREQTAFGMLEAAAIVDRCLSGASAIIEALNVDSAEELVARLVALGCNAQRYYQGRRELLTSMDILKQPKLDLDSLQLAGVPFGADARLVPQARIKEVTLAPIVRSSKSGTNIAPEYYAEGGRRLSLQEVIDDAISHGGVLHFSEAVSFRIDAGRVVGFAFYGQSLRHFDYLQSYDAFCTAFGAAERVVTEEAYGDLMGYTHFYVASRKRVAWDASGNRVSLINLGNFPGNAGA